MHLYTDLFGLYSKGAMMHTAHTGGLCICVSCVYDKVHLQLDNEGAETSFRSFRILASPFRAYPIMSVTGMEASDTIFLMSWQCRH